METVPPKLVVAVAIILVGLAGVGLYQGIHQRGGGDQDTSEGAGTLTAPVAGAKAAAALTDPTAQGLTETQVREIARQEARAALGKPAAPAESDDGAETAGASAAPAKAASTTATAAGALKAAPDRPTLQTPTAPTSAPSEGGQAPLF